MSEKQRVSKRNSKGGNGKVQAAVMEANKTETSPQEPQEAIQAKNDNGGNGKAYEPYTEVVGPDKGPQEPAQAADGNGNRLHKVTDLSNVSVDNFVPSHFDDMATKFGEKLVDAELELSNAFDRLMAAVRFKKDLVNLAAEQMETENRDMLKTYRGKFGIRTSNQDVAEA